MNYLLACQYCGGEGVRDIREGAHVECKKCYARAPDARSWNEMRVPTGWQCVPKEPTEEMLDAWFEADRDEPPCQFVTPYEAMLSAAPKPGEL